METAPQTSDKMSPVKGTSEKGSTNLSARLARLPGVGRVRPGKPNNIRLSSCQGIMNMTHHKKEVSLRG